MMFWGLSHLLWTRLLFRAPSTLAQPRLLQTRNSARRWAMFWDVLRFCRYPRLRLAWSSERWRTLFFCLVHALNPRFSFTPAIAFSGRPLKAPFGIFSKNKPWN